MKSHQQTHYIGALCALPLNTAAANNINQFNCQIGNAFGENEQCSTADFMLFLYHTSMV